MRSFILLISVLCAAVAGAQTLRLSQKQILAGHYKTITLTDTTISWSQDNSSKKEKKISTYKWVFDSHGNILSEKGTGTWFFTDVHYVYTYDSKGRILTKKDKMTTEVYKYEKSGAYTISSNFIGADQPGISEYDERGNMATYRTPSGNVFYYEYDDQARLVSVKSEDEDPDLYFYNDEGLLYRKTIGADKEVLYAYDDKQQQKKITENGPSANIVTELKYNKGLPVTEKEESDYPGYRHMISSRKWTYQ